MAVFLRAFSKVCTSLFDSNLPRAGKRKMQAGQGADNEELPTEVKDHLASLEALVQECFAEMRYMVYDQIDTWIGDWPVLVLSKSEPPHHHEAYSCMIHLVQHHYWKLEVELNHSRHAFQEIRRAGRKRRREEMEDDVSDDTPEFFYVSPEVPREETPEISDWSDDDDS